MAMLPTSRPKISRAEVETILTVRGVIVDECAILGIRGYYENSMGKPNQNDIGIYDDACAVISPGSFKTFNFNTDPARSGRKLAMLKPQRILYYKGKHRGKYDALRPFPEGVKLACTRDGVDSLCSHTNIHKGGVFATFSEGCQTVPPTQYEEFINFVYAQMSLYRQKTIVYELIEED
jgi:lysozyme